MLRQVADDVLVHESEFQSHAVVVVDALRDGRDVHDPRLAPSAPHSEWLPGVHEWQRERLAGRSQE